MTTTPDETSPENQAAPPTRTIEIPIRNCKVDDLTGDVLRALPMQLSPEAIAELEPLLPDALTLVRAHPPGRAKLQIVLVGALCQANVIHERGTATSTMVTPRARPKVEKTGPVNVDVRPPPPDAPPPRTTSPAAPYVKRAPPGKEGPGALEMLRQTGPVDLTAPPRGGQGR
jgi:hypothetical protein